jgi:hypothetical protein
VDRVATAPTSIPSMVTGWTGSLARTIAARQALVMAFDVDALVLADVVRSD